jgi:hypothetical protein
MLRELTTGISFGGVMFYKATSVWVVALTLSACGGGDEAWPSTASVQGRQVVAQAAVNWDQSGFAVNSGQPVPACNIDFTVMGWFSTGGTGAPPDQLRVVAASVYVGSEQLFRAGVIESIPDPAGSGRLRVLSDGCAPAGLAEGMTVTAVFSVRDGTGQQQALAAPPTALTVSH